MQEIKAIKFISIQWIFKKHWDYLNVKWFFNQSFNFTLHYLLLLFKNKLKSIKIFLYFIQIRNATKVINSIYSLDWYCIFFIVKLLFLSFSSFKKFLRVYLLILNNIVLNQHLHFFIYKATPKFFTVLPWFTNKLLKLQKLILLKYINIVFENQSNNLYFPATSLTLQKNRLLGFNNLQKFKCVYSLEPLKINKSFLLLNLDFLLKKYQTPLCSIKNLNWYLYNLIYLTKINKVKIKKINNFFKAKLFIILHLFLIKVKIKFIKTFIFTFKIKYFFIFCNLQKIKKYLILSPPLFKIKNKLSILCLFKHVSYSNIFRKTYIYIYLFFVKVSCNFKFAQNVDINYFISKQILFKSLLKKIQLIAKFFNLEKTRSFKKVKIKNLVCFWYIISYYVKLLILKRYLLLLLLDFLLYTKIVKKNQFTYLQTKYLILFIQKPTLAIQLLPSSTIVQY